jgi:cyclophilin family peptidyl-prolyl cis-trans isomerase
MPPEARDKIRDALSFLARDREPQVRLSAVRGLSAFEDSASAMLASAALGDRDWRVRVEAMRAHGLTVDELRPLLGDPNPNVRLSALDALGHVGRPEEAKALLRAYSPRSTREREVASISLATRMKDDLPGLDSLASSLASSPEWRLRAAASSVLGAAPGTPDPAGVALLEKLAQDEPRVAKTAAGPLLQARAEKAAPGEKLSSTRTDLDLFLASKDPVLRAIAIDAEAAALGDSIPEMESGEWLGIVRKAWNDARADSTSNDVASTIVTALEKVKERAAAAEILREAATGRDYIVRREACRILGTGHAEPIETGRSVSDYESIIGWASGNREIAIRTRGGQIRIRLFCKDAPITCWNFAQLAEKGFFDQGSWHRVVPAFVVQDGCPRGDGYGGPGYAIRCEINDHPYGTGSVGMALSGKDTGGSQFFITQSPQPHLDGRYTVFGEVIEGMELIDRLVQYDPIETIRLLGK